MGTLWTDEVRCRLSSLRSYLAFAGVAALGLLQISCVASATFGVPSAKHQSMLPHWLNVYRALSGTDSTFKFFAPHVASQAISEVRSYRGDVLVHLKRNDRVHNESDLRTMAFSLGLMQQQHPTLLGYALAEDAFKADSSIDRIEVDLGFWQLPTLREGTRKSGSFLILYKGNYARAQGSL